MSATPPHRRTLPGLAATDPASEIVLRELRSLGEEMRSHRDDTDRRLARLERCLPEECEAAGLSERLARVEERLGNVSEAQRDLADEVREALRELADARVDVARLEGASSRRPRSDDATPVPASGFRLVVSGKSLALGGGATAALVAIVTALSRLVGAEPPPPLVPPPAAVQGAQRAEGERGGR